MINLSQSTCRTKDESHTKGVPLETIETAKHYIEKTETTTGLNVVMRIIDKVYETGRKYAENFKKMMTIEFDKRNRSHAEQ
jgi:hypothetical protein